MARIAHVGAFRFAPRIGKLYATRDQPPPSAAGPSMSKSPTSTQSLRNRRCFTAKPRPKRTSARPFWCAQAFRNFSMLSLLWFILLICVVEGAPSVRADAPPRYLAHADGLSSPTGDEEHHFQSRIHPAQTGGQKAQTRDMSAKALVGGIDYVDAFLGIQNEVVWPTPNSDSSNITYTFGPRFLGGAEYDFHMGIDILGYLGDAVVASFPGEVERVITFDIGGLSVFVRHQFSQPVTLHTDKDATDVWYTVYMNLNTTTVSEGTFVSAGDAIGTMGDTNIQSQAMLHHEVRIGTRCSLAYAVANPSSSCNAIEYDPHVHTALIHPQLAAAMELQQVAQLGAESDGVVKVSTPANQPNVNRYEVRVVSADGSTKKEHVLDLSLRTGFDATSVEALDTPKTFFPYLNPIDPDENTDSWEIHLVVPYGWAENSANGDDTVEIKVADVWRRTENLELLHTFTSPSLDRPNPIVSAPQSTPGSTSSPVALPTTSLPPANISYTDAFLTMHDDIVWPLPNSNRTVIISTFGPRLVEFTGVYDFHAGVDIAGSLGDPVLATADGEVIAVPTYDFGGKTVIVRHTFPGPTLFHPDKATTDLWYSVYMHLDTQAVVEGSIISAGDPIGTVGESGAASSPRLHHEIRVGTRCSLQFALENPQSTCNTLGYDPSVHSMLVYRKLEGPRYDIKLQQIASIGPFSNGVVMVTTQADQPNVNRYRVQITSPDGLTKQEHILDLNLRIGFDATSFASLDTQDRSSPYLEPLSFDETEDKWRIQLVVPFGWIEDYADGDVFQMAVHDVWGTEKVVALDHTFTSSPSSMPSMVPSAVLSAAPSLAPSPLSSTVPSQNPSAKPSTATPSLAPSPLTTTVPSQVPSEKPSTATPSLAPSPLTTTVPSHLPSEKPSTVLPSLAPSPLTTTVPSHLPSESPLTQYVTSLPSNVPTISLSYSPSNQPSTTISPTIPPTTEAPASRGRPDVPATPTTAPTNAPFSQPSGSPTNSRAPTVGLAAKTVVSIVGVPEETMGGEEEDVLEGVLLQFLRLQLREDGVEVTKVYVESQNLVPPNGRRLGAVKPVAHSRQMQSGSTPTLDVVIIITGQYNPPPQIDLNELVPESINSESDAVVNTLSSAYVPDSTYFEDVTEVSAREYVDEQSAPPSSSPTPKPIGDRSPGQPSPFAATSDSSHHAAKYVTGFLLFSVVVALVEL